MVKIALYLKDVDHLGVSKSWIDSEIKKVAMGSEVVICSGKEEIETNIADSDILACFGSVFDESMILRSKRLKWVHAFSAGVDKFMVPALLNSDIVLTNASGTHPIQVGEHTFAMLLAFERKIVACEHNRAASKWESYLAADEIYGKVLCVVGAGKIGERIAFLARAFGCKTVGVNQNGRLSENFDKIFSKDNLKTAIAEADYVINVLPFTKETERIFSDGEFLAMKRSALFVNVGRGRTVDEEALIEALKDGTIRGACLDVFEEEPLRPNSSLWKMKNVIITPHMAGESPRYIERGLAVFLENLKAFTENKKLPNEVDKKLGY